MSMETDRIEDDVNQSRHRLTETLSQLGSKLSPGQMLDEGLGLLQGQAGKFAGKLGRQVRDNPLPIALAGIGIAWLILANRSSNEFDTDEKEYHRRRYRTIEEARWATPRMPSETDSAYEERVHQAYTQALGLTQLAGEAAHEFKERVKHTVEGVQYAGTRAGARISRTFKGTGRRIGNVYADGRERMSHLAADAKHLAEDQVERLGHAAEEARHRTERFYDETPLAAGAVALGVGALLGALAPLSSPERRTLSGVADKAARTGADLMDRGARAVGDAVERNVH